MITGKPNQQYYMWVKGTSTMDGSYDNQPPMIASNQVGVMQDAYVAATDPVLIAHTSISNHDVGGYIFQNSGGDTVTSGSIWSNVAHGNSDTVAALKNGTMLYANITLSDSGTRTVEFVTTNWTKAQKYTIRVEQNFAGSVKSDETDITVDKGSMMITAAGDQSYFLGEEIKFSGTNTESQTTYLFITGPNLNQYGSQINQADPRNFPVTGHETSAQTADVQSDNTWSWKWGTANIALDAGTYTVWATSQPSDASSDQLDKCTYGTVSVVIRKPYIAAATAQSTVAQGDKILITGTAEGNPSVGVQIWVLGKNYATINQQSVTADASFT
jgi:hypothetical protein